MREQREDYVSFILLTQERSSSDHLREAFAAGVDNFLSKEIDPLELELCLYVADRILDFTAEIRQLRSSLPICNRGRNIRDDGEYWQRLEDYIERQAASRFSHGNCPNCFAKHVDPQPRP